MAIAKSLPEVHPNFMQECPLCGRLNRMVVEGVWKLGTQVKRHPDMGYSFCNCRSIFYTDPRNVTRPASYEPLDGMVTLPDPYFAWPDPYQFHGWDVRRYPILWDMDEYAQELEGKGYKIMRLWRDMDLDSPTPQCFHIEVKK